MGTSLFTANMDMTNEFGEIHTSTFTSTKAHEAFESSFAAVRESALKYGRPEPEVAYTDNVSDAPMLTKIFPSLLANVHPTDPWSHLPTLPLPFSANVIGGLEHIENFFRTMFYDSHGESGIEDFTLNAGVDIEWNVDIGQFKIGSVGKPAILTIATDTSVTILQISPFINDHKLPPPSSAHFFLYRM